MPTLMMLVLLLSAFATNTYANTTQVRIEGYATLTQSRFTREQKDEQTKEALYNGIQGYYQAHDPHMLAFIKQHIPHPTMIKNVGQLIGEHKVAHRIVDSTLHTDVVAYFNKGDFESRLDTLMTGQSSITLVVVELMQPTQEELLKVVDGVTPSLPEYLKGGNLSVETDYAELTDRTGGVFNLTLLEAEFESRGDIGMAPLNVAAKAKAGLAEAYSVLVSHTLIYAGVDELTETLHLVKLESKARITNAKSGQIETTETVSNVLGQGETMELAAQNGINNATRKLAAKIKSYFLRKL
ncbi:hypothetical protein [Alteromonas sp. C1M14]|uniref:hypothetical protein n=1 Tax=Alteromonas sp. C1M14 TaxID=2841567 RepID=UPI001C08A1BF|nr:hypothetical protein [Alteromonas sp. C1M14]MBU2978223.1 hypothetical protein [Alteromonas sp. C1M14]